MIPFLKQVAKLYYGRYGADVGRVMFVFPNRRSGVFFRKYLLETALKPICSINIVTINELFCKLNSKQAADPIRLLFLLYNIYIRQSGASETFDDFIHWGKMLLNDFDDIDKFLVDAKQLFTNVTDLNTIEKDFSFLKPSQVQAIRQFWSSFRPESNDRNKRFFRSIWELLYPVYKELRETLAAQGLAYEGMIYREVVENFEKTVATGNLFLESCEKIAFVGLNALTKAEQELLRLLKEQNMADFYWDYASEKVKDADNRASFFMKDNLSRFPSACPLPEEEPVDTQIELIGVPSRIGQAKQIYPILEKIIGDSPMTAEEALQTAIVLPDEQLLMPVLHSIPEQIGQINVTLGYPLSGTPVATLMNYLQSLQKNKKITENDTLFYHQDVIAIIRHKYVSSACPQETTAILNGINERNQVYISLSSLQQTPLLKLLFSVPSSAMDISDYLTTVLKELAAAETKETTKDVETVTTQKEKKAVATHALEQEFIFHYYTIINHIREMMRETKTEMSSETYFRLLKQMTDYIKIPFLGEPLLGLQVMGALETRSLDFDNVIILSVNEGIFPAKNAEHSFIPYHLRRGFGLPTQEYQESIWAYHFYRLIHRAKRVFLLYDTRTDGLQSGEVSRFVHQLKYHYKLPVRQKLSVYNISSSQAAPFRVDKDEKVMRAMSLYETEKSLSASAINTYLDCPLKFYLSSIRGISEEEAVSETLRHDLFGTLLHRVMELAYEPLCGKTVTADLLKLTAQEENMTELIRQAFAKDFFHDEEVRPLVGQAFLYGEMIRKYACKILEHDRSLTPFQYIESEKRFLIKYAITGGRRINIKGFIDRIDRVNDTVRIIDYKSGRPVAMTFSDMSSLFDPSEKDRKKAILQVFLYAWIFASETAEKRIQPTIYYTRNLFKPNDFNPIITQIIEKEKTVIDRFENDCATFEECLQTCLNEMFDPNRPFTQTTHAKHCELCPFACICGTYGI